MKAKVLITTGAGRTGAAAAKELIDHGYAVRALVRRDDHRAQRLRRWGVEVFVGNLYDLRDLRKALRGVQRAYHCPPFDAKHLHGAMLFALAAEEAKVEVVALMSGWNPHPMHPSVMQREHWLANNIYRRMPSVDVIHINPGLFAFTYFLGLPAIVHAGMLTLPFGEGLNAPPSNEDIGAVAAHALMKPQNYLGRCLRPMGPKRISPQEAAEIMGKVLGRKVRYQSISTKMFAKAARAQGFPIFQIAQVRHYAAELRAGAYGQEPSNHVQEVVGRAPDDFETIARRYFRGPEAIMPGLSAGGFLGAMALSMKILFTRAIDLDSWEAARDYPLIDAGLLAHESTEWQQAASSSRLVLQPDLS